MGDEYSDRLRTDQLFECLSNHRRRFVLQYLAEEADPVPVDELTTTLVRWEAENDDPSDDHLEEISIALHHHHLPKLAAADLITTDDEKLVLEEESIVSVIEQAAGPTEELERSSGIQLEYKGSSVSEPDADILLVEDNPGDVRLIKEAFVDAQIANSIYVVGDGEEAIDFIYQRDTYVGTPRPDLILLDLNLPRMNGDEVLAELKNNPELDHIPVIVLTGSKAEEDIIRSYDLNANAYLTKPVEPNEFVNLVRSLEHFWLSLVRLPPHTRSD